MLPRGLLRHERNQEEREREEIAQEENRCNVKKIRTSKVEEIETGKTPQGVDRNKKKVFVQTSLSLFP